MRVIVHNDDIGLTYGFTEAIKDSYQIGNTTSTSIRTNGTAFDYSVELLKSTLSDIGLGIHFNITDGPAHTSALSDNNGDYKYSFFGLFKKLQSNNKDLLSLIEYDFEYQMKLLKNNDLKVDHINSQQHVHMIPSIFELCCKLAKKHRIKYIRFVKEPFHLSKDMAGNISPFVNGNIIKHILLNYFSKKNLSLLKKYNLYSNDAFYGVLRTNNMNLVSIESALQDAKKRGLETIEILAHPAYSDDKRDTKFTSNHIKKYVRSKNRRSETETFISEELKNLFNKEKVNLINYRDLS